MNKEKLMRILKFLFGAVMIISSIAFAAADARALSLFGYHVGFDGVKKDEPVREVPVRELKQTEEQSQNINQHERQMKQTEEQIQHTSTQQEREIEEMEEWVDVSEAIDLANSDPYTTTALKSFSGDNFCLETEKRIAHLTVLDDGTIAFLDGKPSKCSEISTTEGYLSRVWEKVNNRERISYKEVKENVKIPWKLKMKFMYAGIMNNGKESFG